MKIIPLKNIITHVDMYNDIGITEYGYYTGILYHSSDDDIEFFSKQQTCFYSYPHCIEKKINTYVIKIKNRACEYFIDDDEVRIKIHHHDKIYKIDKNVFSKIEIRNILQSDSYEIDCKIQEEIYS